MTEQFFWKNMANTVKEYVKACPISQQAKYNTLPPAGPFQPLPILYHIWQDIAMDFVIGLLMSHGYSVKLVVIDHLSKFAHFIPLTASTPKVVDAFIKMVVSVHGIPKTIVSSRDKVFTSKFWEQICVYQGISLVCSSAYLPSRMDKQRYFIDA